MSFTQEITGSSTAILLIFENVHMVAKLGQKLVINNFLSTQSKENAIIVSKTYMCTAVDLTFIFSP